MAIKNQREERMEEHTSEKKKEIRHNIQKDNEMERQNIKNKKEKKTGEKRYKNLRFYFSTFSTNGLRFD